MEAINWDNVECMPLPQEMVGSGVGGKLAPRRLNILACTNEEVILKSGSKNRFCN
jgi:hypothetical protein